MRNPTNKQRSYLLAGLYKTLYATPLARVGHDARLRAFLYLSWVFERLAANASYAYYAPEDHPSRRVTWEGIARHLEPSWRVVDVGCAGGYYTHLIAQHAASAVGLDRNAASIERARATYQRDNLRFELADANEFLAASDGRYDLLVLTHVLEHLDEPEAFLRGFRERVRYLYLEVPDFDAHIFNAIRRELGTPFIYSDEEHAWEFEREEQETLVRRAGYTVEQTHRHFGVQTLFARA